MKPASLTTARLQLRCPEAGDLPALFAIRADPQVARYGSGGPWRDMAEARAWLDGIEIGHTQGEAWQWVVARAEGPVIGTCALFHIHRGCRRAELGYLLGRPHWGKGYMTEALEALIDHAFGPMELRRLEADVDPANTPSTRLLQRLGFMHEGRLRERWEVGGSVSDSDIYGLLARDRRAGSRG